MNLRRQFLCRISVLLACQLAVSLVGLPTNKVRGQEAGLKIIPEKIELDSPDEVDQLIVTVLAPNQSSADVTEQAKFEVSPPIALITGQGQVQALQSGEAAIKISWREQSASIPIRIGRIEEAAPISFHRDVLPMLTKSGCNSGGCHGKAEGQNGFRLSVFGSDAEADLDAIMRESRGRRVSLASPDESLLLQKAAGILPHGGGVKIERDSVWYRKLRRWIADGCPHNPTEVDSVLGIEVEPAELSFPVAATHQLRVTAVYESGFRRGVTVESDFQSNFDAVAGVDSLGKVRVNEVPGEAAILVRYQGQVGICRVTRPKQTSALGSIPVGNKLDAAVANKLNGLGIPASPRVNDAGFVRRVYLDTIGRLPTLEETRSFLEDTSADKRDRLIDQLLQRPEYAEYWAMLWSDLLRVDKDKIGGEAAAGMHSWLRESFSQNKPYDLFAKEILTASGSTLAGSPAPFFQVHDSPESLTKSVSQLFLGVRIECAQCHHHPMEKWDRGDFYSLASFFTGIERNGGVNGSVTIRDGKATDLQIPKTTRVVTAKPLGESSLESDPNADANASPTETSKSDVARRQSLADWATSADNPFFATLICNRLWGHYLGRGIIEPIDDIRATNPPSNPELLDELRKELIASKFDLKHVTRIILQSETYQRSSTSTSENADDLQNYSHGLWKSMPAEVLLDSISDVTGTPAEFQGWPRGTRAIQIWDSQIPSPFFSTFGRPTRQTVCSCERDEEPSITQALHMLNAPELESMLHNRKGRVARLATSSLSDSAIITELYLVAFSRQPSNEELEHGVELLRTSSNRREACEDFLWSLMNNKEFMFIR